MLLFAQVAHHAVQAAQTAQPQPVADKPNWTEVAGFWATLAGVIATFGAVLVALFGQRLRASWSRPKIALTIDPSSDDVVPINISETDNVYGNRLLVTNERGRDTAKEVEVFVTIANDPDERQARSYRELISGALVFDSPWAADARAISSVPSSFARPVWFVVAGPVRAVSKVVQIDVDAFLMAAHHCKVDDSATAGITIEPAVAGHADAWLLPASHYDVEFVITGSNFDAIHYKARIRLDFEDTELSRYFKLNWLTPPTRYTPRPQPRQL
jgi:hypothetical protein